jgi:hypothetical protein
VECAILDVLLVHIKHLVNSVCWQGSSCVKSLLG